MKSLYYLFFLLVASVVFAQPVKAGISIESLTVSSLPSVSVNGISWDALSNPDVYFRIFNSFGNEIAVSETCQDVGQSDFPLVWKFENAVIIPDSNMQYYICFYDEDMTKSELIDETDLYYLSSESYEFQMLINTKKYNAINIIGYEHYLME